MRVVENLDLPKPRLAVGGYVESTGPLKRPGTLGRDKLVTVRLSLRERSAAADWTPKILFRLGQHLSFALPHV